MRSSGPVSDTVCTQPAGVLAQRDLGGYGGADLCDEPPGTPCVLAGGHMD